jgi:hypothetical protein
MQRIFPVFIVFFISLVFLAGQIKNDKTAAPRSGLFNAEKLLQDLKTLSADEMQGRAPGTEGSRKAREYIVERFKQSGLQQFNNSYLQSFTFSPRNETRELQGTNVAGYIRGTKEADKYIVVTAHYDHLGVKNGAIYNGADDNASGTAALFALAEHFKNNRPAHSIIFVAFDAEESGFVGARKFLAKPPVDKKAILLNINLDMISHNERGELYASGTYHYRFLKPFLEEVKKRSQIKLSFGHDTPGTGSEDWTSQSDHFVFHGEKIPFIYFGVEDHKDYHKPTDDFENINREFYVRAVETVLAAVKSFDRNGKAIERQKTGK